MRFITAGQAFHWFNVDGAAKEFRRIVQPGGFVVLIWNERVNDASPFMCEYDRLIQRFTRPDETSRARQWEDNGLQSIDRLFGSARYQLTKFENPQLLDRPGLLDRIHSSSYMPLPVDAAYAGLLENVNDLFETHQVNQTVCIMHETHVYYDTL